MCKSCKIINNSNKFSVGYSCVKQSVHSLLVLKDGTEIYGKNEQFRKVDKCPRIEQGRKDYELCDTACVQVTHAERDAIWKAISLGFDTKGATMFLTGHWVCCDDCRRSMKVAGIKECYIINDNDKIIN